MAGPRVLYCTVYGCKNRSYLKPKLSFFKLPADTERRIEWLRLIGREDLSDRPARSYTVCQEHFSVPDVLQGSQRKTLRKDSLPTLHLPDLQKRNRALRKYLPGFGSKCASGSSVPTTGQDDGSPVSSDCEDLVIHEGISCSNCSGEIIGFRYKCLSCVGYNLCSGCEGRGKHPEHYVLRIPRPVTNEHVQEILKPFQNLLAVQEADMPNVPKKQKKDVQKEKEDVKKKKIKKGTPEANVIVHVIEPEVRQNEDIGDANKEVDPLIVKQEQEDVPVEFPNSEHTHALTQPHQGASGSQSQIGHSADMDYSDTLFFLGIKPEPGKGTEGDINIDEPSSAMGGLAGVTADDKETSDQMESDESIEVKCEPESSSDDERISVFTHHTRPKKRKHK